MKILRLDESSLNIQKCLLPDCDFLKNYYGRYCLINVSDSDCKVLVKIGLCECKQIRGALFLDKSVLNFSLFERINRLKDAVETTFDNFIILNEPMVAKNVKVIVVFADVFDVKKYRFNEKLKKIVKDILKLYKFCSGSAVFLNNLSKFQRFGISCLIVMSERNLKKNQVYEIDPTTQIAIEECISQLKFEQLQRKKKEFQIGGCNKVFAVLKETITLGKLCDEKNATLVKKLLLIGPTGCGKTTLVRSVVKHCNCVLLEFQASVINSLKPEDSLKELVNVFSKSKIYAENGDFCVILIEDIDVMLMGKSFHSRKFISHLISLLEDIETTVRVLVIATTNCPEQVSLQLKKPKMFEDELEIMIPTVEEREDIILNLLDYCEVKCDKYVTLQLAKWTPGFVGADLQLALFEALMIIYKNQGSVKISNELLEVSFKQALTKVIPSSLRGAVGLCTAKESTFSQIGGLENIKKILDLSVKQQLKNPEIFQRLGVPLTKGILLYGPPGCAKTSLVKALARECDTTFLATSAADLYSPFVGDAEKKIVQLFTQARIGSPSIVFIDEIDAVVGSKYGDRQRGVQERILSTLLVEMDGVGLEVNTQRNNSLSILGNSSEDVPHSKHSTNYGVIVIGATNRPQFLDDALKRPGRFDRLLYVPPPDETERLRILKKLTENVSLHESVNLERIAKQTAFYSGADLKNLCQESGLYALKTSTMAADSIHQSHFEYVQAGYNPSLNEKIISFYESFQNYNA